MNGREDCLVMIRDDVQWTTEDGIFLKGMLIEKAGTIVSQHSHVYGHTSLVAKGAVRIWTTDERQYLDYEAPATIFIPAETMHKFQSLVDDTAVYCIHNVDKTNGVVQIKEKVVA